MTVLNSPKLKPVPSIDQVAAAAKKAVNEHFSNMHEYLQTIRKSVVQTVTPVIMKAQKQEALMKTQRQKPLIKSEEFKPVEVKLPEANTKQFTFDLNTYNVTSKEDLERLSDRLFDEHQTAKRNNRKEAAALLERTINIIEMHNTVPEAAYRPLAELGIVLVKPE